MLAQSHMGHAAGSPVVGAASFCAGLRRLLRLCLSLRCFV